MSSELGIEWTTQKRKLSELIEWEHNPRQLTAKQAADLAASLKRFGYVEPIAINTDGTILGGHMRRKVMMAQALLDPGQEVEVRVPSRELTLVEVAELNVRLNRNSGEWDYDALANVFDEGALKAWGFTDFDFGKFPSMDGGVKRQPPAVTLVELDTLKAHPRNYKKHPQDQLDHLKASINENGIYRNVVVARGSVILAGHGIVEAARQLGIKRVPILSLDVDPEDPRALKVLAGDNEIANAGDVDDRALTELLKGVLDADMDLLGTGFDEQQLSALLFNTRPAHEVKDKNAANQWVGMPEYDEGGVPIRLVIHFKTEADRQAFVDQAELTIVKTTAATWSTRWPFVPLEVVSDIRFEERPTEPKA